MIEPGKLMTKQAASQPSVAKTIYRVIGAQCRKGRAQYRVRIEDEPSQLLPPRLRERRRNPSSGDAQPREYDSSRSPGAVTN
ncbi:MAG TPA: hypothetical protein VLK65_10935 [Vicinamibacteria bacterium]|nr:hypothetical protein [Vicinamibacteria bacterium]